MTSYSLRKGKCCRARVWYNLDQGAREINSSFEALVMQNFAENSTFGNLNELEIGLTVSPVSSDLTREP